MGGEQRPRQGAVRLAGRGAGEGLGWPEDNEGRACRGQV